MTNEQAYVILENCASLLDSGTRFFTEDHTKQFHEAYELAMKTLRKTERKRGKWIDGFDERFVKCSECGMETTRNELQGIALFGEKEPNFCPNCGAQMLEGES